MANQELVKVVDRHMFYIYNSVHYRVEDMKRHLAWSKAELKKTPEAEWNVFQISLRGTCNHLEALIKEYSVVEQELRPFFYEESIKHNKHPAA